MITIKGAANSGTTWYALHKAVHYCKARYSPKSSINRQPIIWVYSELLHEDLVRRIDELYPDENVLGVDGYATLRTYNNEIPYRLDDIISESMEWNTSDVVIVDNAIIHSINSKTSNYQDESNTIKYTFDALQNHQQVIMFYREQINRNEIVDLASSYTHDKFEWDFKSEEGTHYVNLVNH